MITFIIAFLCLILGYLIYGRIVEKVFDPDATANMPCYEKQDGVDFMPMKTWKVFLIQFLNIAGTGPIFGAIMGILFGPMSYLWIVLGCIFAGSVHDYMCGMICIRKGGVSLPEIIGDELGGIMRQLMRIFSLVLLVLVGAVFVTTPASLLESMTPANGFWFSQWFWIIVIFLYYILATLLPIDKLIGKVYPIFGLALLIMAAGLCWGIFTQKGYVPEITDGFLTSHHPDGLPIFPFLCITIACGAISGFHGTQSPLMSRCLINEKYGRPIFYGAMIIEGVVALIWAAAAIKFADSLPGTGTAYEKLQTLGNPALVVHEVGRSWMGSVGVVLAVLGVVAAPITSGDTAFRSARLIIADFMHVSQKTFLRRLMICLPMFVVAAALMFMDFNALWRYFAWTNQTLATFMLWAATMWLTAKYRKSIVKPLITLIPALFMTAVCTSYIIVAPEGFQMPIEIGIVCGYMMALFLLFIYIIFRIERKNNFMHLKRFMRKVENEKD